MASYRTDTSQYKLNHTMLRVKDPVRSIKFYEDNFGMKVINRLDFEEAKFSLYFLAFDSAAEGQHWTDREALLELTHNYGTENNPDYKIANGNHSPGRGFGHICFTVDHVEAACTRLEANGVQFHKRLADGRMKHIAFALDPDGYWVELIGHPGSSSTETATNLACYRFNHTMIRVKDPEKSLNFYRSVLGMSLLRAHDNPEARFGLYFLGYRHGGKGEVTTAASAEGIVELTWNYGTETDPAFAYHNGNNDPQGFGHLCVSVDSLDDACARFDDLGVDWKKRLTDGRMKTVAFIHDPDKYWIEIIQNEALRRNAGW